MPPVSPTLNNQTDFLAGATSGGIVVSPTFSTLIGEATDQTPTAPAGAATYDTAMSKAYKWGSATPGTASGTISFAYDPASSYTATEQNLYQSSMALWSAEANVTFVLTASYADAALKITRGTDKSAFATDNNNNPVAVGGSVLGVTTTAKLSIDTSATPSFGPLVNVNTGSGYPAGTIVHELGHVLGLGHGGPYNGKVNEATQQFSQYDTGLYTIMSYIDPKTTSAQYYSSYTVAGTNWNDYSGPETPMQLDISAIQNLYGLPTTTPLSGGQVFGYNSNITGQLAAYFDFSQNTTPVLTLWNAGTNNTLNLSGYGTASRVNLNPGTFSSANGMVNNIGIAFNTAINTAIGGGGDDVFTVNAAANTIDGMAGTNTVIFSGNLADYTLDSTGGTITVTKVSNSVADALTNITTLQFADTAVQTASIACFGHGTLIATPTGDQLVERLAIGDLVVTAAGAHRPIKWLGRRSYAGRFLLANPKVRPIRFTAGSLGGGLPRHDLLISPDHAMLLDGALFPARCLANGTTIAPDRACTRIDYVHIELDSHDVILAEGAASETFLDDDSRGMFHNAADYAGLYGAADPALPFCAPRHDRGYALQAVLDALAARSIAA